MYTVGVEHVKGIKFADGNWLIQLDCGHEAVALFLAADQDILCLPDEIILGCEDCPKIGNCFVTKVERKKDADNTD